MLLSESCTAEFELVFVLTLENAFSYRVHFEANRKSIGSSKNGTRDFQKSPRFEKLACFYMTITRNFEPSQYFNFETNFLENENIFQKAGVPFFS